MWSAKSVDELRRVCFVCIRMKSIYTANPGRIYLRNKNLFNENEQIRLAAKWKSKMEIYTQLIAD